MCQSEEEEEEGESETSFPELLGHLSTHPHTLDEVKALTIATEAFRGDCPSKSMASSPPMHAILTLQSCQLFQLSGFSSSHLKRKATFSFWYNVYMLLLPLCSIHGMSLDFACVPS